MMRLLFILLALHFLFCIILFPYTVVGHDVKFGGDDEEELIEPERFNAQESISRAENLKVEIDAATSASSTSMEGEKEPDIESPEETIQPKKEPSKQKTTTKKVKSNNSTRTSRNNTSNSSRAGRGTSTGSVDENDLLKLHIKTKNNSREGPKPDEGEQSSEQNKSKVSDAEQVERANNLKREKERHRSGMSIAKVNLTSVAPIHRQSVNLSYRQHS